MLNQASEDHYTNTIILHSDQGCKVSTSVLFIILECGKGIQSMSKLMQGKTVQIMALMEPLGEF